MNNRIAFVLAATQQGAMIVNRLDAYFQPDGSGGIGVGLSLLEQSNYELSEVMTCVQLLALRRQHFGDGVVAYDCGANIGTHTIPWALSMTGWGEVVAIEAQERIYYALCGNIALNNCFNARAMLAAVSSEHEATMRVPKLDHQQMASFGSLELRTHRDDGTPAEAMGQAADAVPLIAIKTVSLDSLGLAVRRVDLIKLDVEGMEMEALRGASAMIQAQHPILIVEWLKVGRDPLEKLLTAWGYKCYYTHQGLNLLAVHESDPTLASVQRQPQTGA